LVRAEFRTDGVDLFVNHLGELLAASTSEKEVLHQSLVNHLNRMKLMSLVLLVGCSLLALSR
jgi:hypothetical protein